MADRLKVKIPIFVNCSFHSLKSILLLLIHHGSLFSLWIYSFLSNIAQYNKPEVLISVDRKKKYTASDRQNKSEMGEGVGG